MPFFATILFVRWLILLAMGIVVLNWVFRPPYYDSIDVVMLIGFLIMFFVIVSGLVSVMYGVDTL